jgi:hypothetical protein
VGETKPAFIQSGHIWKAANLLRNDGTSAKSQKICLDSSAFLRTATKPARVKFWFEFIDGQTVLDRT